MAENDTKYIILEKDNSYSLQEAVNEKIAEGWKPCGGLVVMRYTYGEYEEVEWLWSQAMVKDSAA